MPTYEYQCRKCGYRFEEFQRIVDPPIRDCPKCKIEGSVEQIISGGSGLIFKGSGFYETDYKRSSSKHDNAGSDSAAESSESTPTETKPSSDN